MRHRTSLLIIAGLLAWPGVPVLAQNKVDQQLFLELRTLQAQVQQLTLALNTVNERLKLADGRVDSQTNTISKGFADQKGQIDAIGSAVRILKESENDSAVRLLQLNQEFKVLRDAVSAQQTLLNEILAQVQRPVGSLPGVSDPAPLTGPPAATGAAIPPSPTEYYRAAMQYFFQSQWENAIAALTAALQKYPESPEAAGAQMRIGESYASMGGHDQEALAAYDLVTKNYKDPDVVPDALYRKGVLLERLGQKDNAGKVLQDLRLRYPDSSAAALAIPVLKRLGIIK